MKQMEKFTYNGLLLITNSIFLAIIYWICHGRVYIYSTGKTGGYISGMALIAFEVMVMITLYIIHDYLRIERTVKNLIKHCGISASAIGFVSLIGMPFGNRAITIIRAVMFVTAAFIVFIIARHLHKLKKEGHIIPARKALLKYYTLVMPVIATVGFIFAGIQIHNVVRAQLEYDRYVQASENKNSTTDGVVDAENIIEIASKLTPDTYAELSTSEKQSTYKQLADIITGMYGTKEIYQVVFIEMDEKIDGSYSHNENIIKLSTNIANDQTQCIITLMHELYHSIEWSYADHYKDIEDKLTDDQLKLYIFTKIRTYRDEFENYPNMDEPGGYTEYRNLECEEDADKFALKYANAVLRMVAAMTEREGE